MASGAEMMLKAMLGIDPAEIRAQAEAFLAQIAQGMQQLQEKQLQIDNALVRIEQQQEMALILMRGMALSMADRSPSHFQVPRALDMEAFDADAVFPKQSVQ